MGKLTIGRVQGSSVFTSSVNSASNVAISTLQPTNISPFVGDSVLFPNGDLRRIVSKTDTHVACSNVVSNIKGPQGMPGEKGDMGGADGLTVIQDENGKNMLYLTYAGEIIGDGIPIPESSGSGGGGGSSSNNAVMTAKSTTGWIAKTIAESSDCSVTFTWSSIEDELSTGKGVLKVMVGGVAKTSYEIEQGDITVDIGKYLSKGANRVKLEITDVYGNTRTISYSITRASVNLLSYFDGTQPYSGQITYNYIPTSGVVEEKTVHFILDGSEIGTQTIKSNGRQQTFVIPSQPHGSHTFEVYFTCTIDGQTVPSNHYYYDLICYEDGNNTPIISVPFKVESVQQFSTVSIPFSVYTPNALTSTVLLKEGAIVKEERTVDRIQRSWAYKAVYEGTTNLSIVCGDVVKPISFNVTYSDIGVDAETQSLELYLSSMGRSNDTENPLTWTYGDVSAEMTNFNLASDGWQLDENNNTVLRVTGDARVNIPFNIFKNNFTTSGKTIEIEFATRDVLNYDSTIISSWSGERGIKITAQKALFKSASSEIFTQYKENETVRISFVVGTNNDGRLLSIYINGIMSGVVQYANDDNFQQYPDVGISIGSNECTTDIYCIRVYGTNLSRHQILENWIADTQDIGLLAERYTRNNIYDKDNNISISQLPSNVPYMILNCSDYSYLPQSKGDKKTIGGKYVDPLNENRSFTFEGAEIDVQGTSSATYPRKNYKIGFNGGFTIKGEHNANYKLRDTSMPTNIFTFKTDYASSEGANNVELVRLYEDTCPVKTPPQITDARVRQGIDGLPILMFYGGEDNPIFLGKYNFNNDKATPEVFGFKEGDESWEILQNNTDMVIWKDDNFEGDAWKLSFEARYPEDNTDTTKLKEFSSWLKSTDTTVPGLSDEEKQARIHKFKNEFENYVNKEAMLFNYIFTEAFLMVDNRAKNAFPTRFDADGKWLILPYDYDSAIGINNEGELKFGYELEDIDLINGNVVYNGQESVLYVNMRLAFADEIMDMYKQLRRDDVFAYDVIEKRFEDHQSVWGEAVYNEDAQFKYIDPFLNEGKAYLPMLQGSKAEQRKWWLYNRFRYLDSKYNAGDALEDVIKIRSRAVSDIEVTPYADIYAAAKYDSALVQKRALRGNSYVLENPLTGGNDSDIIIYSASQLSSVGDLSGFKANMADFSQAIKLTSLKVGDGAEDYDNPNLTELIVGNLSLLRTLDVRKCSNLSKTVDISGCTNIEHVYFEGTKTTGVTLPNGGILKTLHLPNTVTNLTIRNQRQLTDFEFDGWSNLTTLRLENVSGEAINMNTVLDNLQQNCRVRVLGVEWNVNSVEEIHAIMSKLDKFTGLDEFGNNVDKAVVGGTVHIPTIFSDELSEINRAYPYITVDYGAITHRVRFYNGDELISEQVVAVGDKITIPSTPTKESTAQYDFVFKGWSIDGVNTVSLPTTVTFGETYHALFTEYLRYYTVRFMNGTTVLQSGLVAYGEIPVYAGNEPSSGDDEYVFVGWTSDIVAVTGDVDYAAQFKYTGSIARGLIQRTIKGEYRNENITEFTTNCVFYDCNYLTGIDFPNLTSVSGYGIFYNCNALVNVNLPNLTITGESMFYNCSNLTHLDLPNVTVINNYLCEDCSKLISVNIPKVTKITSMAFYKCSSLQSIDLTNVTDIAGNAFYSNSSLAKVILPANPPTIQSSTFGSGTNAVPTTCIFYIPTGSLAAYQSATNWSTLTGKYTFIQEDR